MSSMSGLNKKQRQARARTAAEARWNGSSAHLAPRGNSPDQAFGQALVAAEKRLAEALNEQNYHASGYHRVNREIPQLQRIVAALRGQAGVSDPHYARAPQYQPPVPNYSVEQVMGDAPIPVQTPQQPYIPEPQPANPPHPRPAAHPLAGGGAIGVIPEEAAVQDEDQFLNEKTTGLPGGTWR